MNVVGSLLFASLVVFCYGKSIEKIVGGTDADDGAFPYQVSMRMRGRHSCGGSILNHRWLLTAAHCIYGQNPENIIIITGTNSLSRGGEAYQADELIPHDHYNPFTIKNDIGLIHVTSDIAFGPTVQPIALPTSDFTSDDYPAVLSGWGRIEYMGSVPDNLQTAELRVIGQKRCEASNWRATATNICTYTKKGQGACHGDSGGPLTADGVQIGIVSFGVPCAAGSPDVFTRVWSFHDWIDEHVTVDEEQETTPA